MTDADLLMATHHSIIMPRRKRYTFRPAAFARRPRWFVALVHKMAKP